MARKGRKGRKGVYCKGFTKSNGKRGKLCFKDGKIISAARAKSLRK